MGLYGSYIGIYEKTGLHGSYVTPYKNIQDYMGLYAIIWGSTRLYGVVRDYMGLYRIIRGCTRLYGNKRKYTGLIILITQITLITGIKLNHHNNLDSHQYNSPITLKPDNLYGSLTISMEP